MKFKRLPPNELQKLEKDFVEFLVSNGITADDWLALKEQSPEKSNDLIDLFSDIVYQRVMEKVEYLEYRTHRDMKAFYCGPSEIKMIGIEVDPEIEIDLRKGDELKRLGDIIAANPESIAVFSGTKEYKPSRGEEIFRMMDSGALKTDSTWFELLENLYEKSKKN